MLHSYYCVVYLYFIISLCKGHIVMNVIDVICSNSTLAVFLFVCLLFYKLICNFINFIYAYLADPLTQSNLQASSSRVESLTQEPTSGSLIVLGCKLTTFQSVDHCPNQ